MNGIVNLDKPAGISSARAVAGVKRLLPRGVKIGHAGTLDPFATGVLLLLIGRSTRLCERLMGQPKRYDAVVRLGQTTPTDDPESAVTECPVARVPAREEISAVLQGMVGEIQQRPPSFSALKVGGRRAYQLARKGELPEMKPRTVSVYSIDLIDYQWPEVKLSVHCGRGTYIRAIARDLGEALGIGGHLRVLRRTAIGHFEVSSSVQLAQLQSEGVEAHLQSWPSASSEASL